jgi:DNA-binding SARP family transcriptional activator
MDRSTAPRPRLRLLGDFEVTFDHEPVQASVPAQRLLAYLAVLHRGRPVRRSALAERLWPETTPARATSNLRSVLWRLPRSRGRMLVEGNATNVRLHDEVRVDLWDGEGISARLCGPTGEDEAILEAALEALPVLQCDLLPDWHDEWLVVEQESYRQRRLHALERLTAMLRDQGRYTDAISAGLVAVRCEPLRESAHRGVIAVHLAEGNHAEALRQYDGYRRLIARELGLRPSPAIRSMVAPLLGRPVDAC